MIVMVLPLNESGSGGVFGVYADCENTGDVENDCNGEGGCDAMGMVTMVVMVITMLVMVTVVLVVVMMITCSEVHDVSLHRGDTGAVIETLVS